MARVEAKLQGLQLEELYSGQAAYRSAMSRFTIIARLTHPEHQGHEDPQLVRDNVPVRLKEEDDCYRALCKELETLHSQWYLAYRRLL